MAGPSTAPTIGRNNDAKSSNTAVLWSPLHLSNLDTPNSTSSLTCSLTDLTPPVAAFDKLKISTSDTISHPQAASNMYMDGDEYKHLLECPTEDLHAIQFQETQRRSRTSTMANIHAAFGSSKKLQQMLGLQSPEPFACPPPIPPDLEMRFEAGAQEYGLDYHLPEGNPLETMKQAANEEKRMTMAISLGKAVLRDIKEESESPVKVTHAHAEVDSGAAPSGLTINAPLWDSGYEAVGGSEHMVPNAAQNDAIHLTDNTDLGQQATTYPPEHAWTSWYDEGISETEYEDDLTYDNPYSGFGSTTTLADSETSRPGTSAATNNYGSTLDALPPAPATSLMDTFESPQYSLIGAGYKAPPRGSSLVHLAPPPRGSSLVHLAQHRAYSARVLQPNPVSDQTHTKGPGPYFSQTRNASAPIVLFPSPRVEQNDSWHVDQDPTPKKTPRRCNSFAFHDTTIMPALACFAAETFMLPQISVRSPSPKRLPASKKRAAGSQGLPPAQPHHDDTTIGLPILSTDQEFLWKSDFPGNMPSLLTILLPWSVSLHRLFTTCPNTYLYSINPAFPHPITPPVHTRLVSAAFYDTSVTPHKEIRFLGPNDCGEMSYNEVDIFSYTRASAITGEEQERMSNIKRALRIKASKNAGDGEGRWSYILIQGHREKAGETPPHMVIAWPTSSATSTSDCLHTIFPDESRPVLPTFTPTPKRFASIQNLRLRKEIRAASSCEDLGVHKVGGLEVEGQVTLKRRVVKMEKAGGVPLIEGWRVDVRKWEGWLRGVGEGRGKVIMWMDR